MIRYQAHKFNKLIDIILDENNGDISLRKDAITELKNHPMTKDMLDKISRADRLYGLPSDLQGLIDFKKDQRIQDVSTMIEDVGENLNISNVDDFCLFLGISGDSTFDEIVDKAHIAVRSGNMRQPRAIQVV